MSTEFVIANVSLRRLNALVETIMYQTGQNDPNEAINLINLGEWVASSRPCFWDERDGVVYFSVKSTLGKKDLRSGLDYLYDNGFSVHDRASCILRNSPSLEPTNDIRVAVLTPKLFDYPVTTDEIRALAAEMGFITPNATLALPILRQCSDSDMRAMGFSNIVIMHEAHRRTDYTDHELFLLEVSTRRWLGTCNGTPDRRWGSDDGGFAFVVPESGV